MGMKTAVIFLVLLFLDVRALSAGSSYRKKSEACGSETSRRESLVRSITISTGAFALLNPSRSEAKTTTTTKLNPLPNLIEARDTLDTLLTNYKRATIDCTYADVPRELLEAKNKELLLEKASTFALFDKSVSVETCKTTNRVVRDYLGVTGKGPLVQIEKQIKGGLEYVDPDDLEDYVSGKQLNFVCDQQRSSVCNWLTLLCFLWNRIGEILPSLQQSFVVELCCGNRRL